MPEDSPLVYITSQDALTERFAVSPPPTVWAYLRVGAEAPTEGACVEQQAAIEKHAEQEEVQAPVFILDNTDAESPRPLLLRLLSHLASIKNAHLFVSSMDRFSDSIGEQEGIFWILNRSGIELHVCNPPADEDVARKTVRTAFSVIHLYQSALTSVQENPGLLLKSLSGQFTGGSPPFGYKVENGELFIEEQTAKMVRYIFFLRLYYPMSASQIGKHIETHKTPADTYKYTDRKVFKILAREKLYRGIYTDCYGATHPRPDLKILPDDKDDLRDLHIKETPSEPAINA